MLRSKIGICVLATAALLPRTAEAYDGQAASQYIEKWINTINGRNDFNTPGTTYPDAKVDYVNNSRAKFGGTGNFTWSPDVSR